MKVFKLLKTLLILNSAKVSLKHLFAKNFCYVG